MASFESNIDQSQLPVSINDIRDKYFEGDRLSEEEHRALKNYDAYRVAYLNASENEEVFEKRYLELQAKANLTPYSYFADKSNLNL